MTLDFHHRSFFSEELLAWYRRGNRDLPWRRSRDPYHIWVSEVMLQQTRVETVIPYYHRFLERFPTIEALADAPEEDVLKLWEGLGYYSRARNLQSAVREVKERYGSVVPDTKEDISTLKGVGPYTSGAILSIAYNKPEPAVDGNVMRVLSRFFLIEDDIMKPGTRVVMERLARELIPGGAAGDFNQALMEFGALVCTPRSPHCLTCPVMEHCAARAHGKEEALPVKKKAKPPRPESRLAALVEGTGANAGKVLIRQRPQEGLLARMWELPHVMADGEEAEGATAAAHNADARQMRRLRDALLQEDGLLVQPLEPYMAAEHTFSHIHWDMQVYRCSIGEGSASLERKAGSELAAIRGEAQPDDEGQPAARSAGRTAPLPDMLPYHYRWVGPSELEQYAFPNVFVRIFREYFGKRSSLAAK